MAWIEKRNTTRREDKAYSLLGIFAIHMPLIYDGGENNAFRRLREEINKASKSEQAYDQAEDRCLADLRSPDPRDDKKHIQCCETRTAGCLVTPNTSDSATTKTGGCSGSRATRARARLCSFAASSTN